jgi:hypothetical protein
VEQPEQQPRLAIVIPTFNEADTIGRTLAHLQQLSVASKTEQAKSVEIIVVDGGSQDDTCQQVRAFKVQLLQNTNGRAAQLNQGAIAARSDIVLFLHADTLLPPDFQTQVVQILQQPRVILGAFQLQIEGQDRALRWVERAVRWRSRWMQLPYGDQALFLRRSTFLAIGGFPLQPIMEDFVLVQRLRREGKIAIAPAAVLTSGRRWHKLGVCRTTLLNQVIILGYYAGISPQRLSQWYRNQR